MSDASGTDPEREREEQQAGEQRASSRPDGGFVTGRPVTDGGARWPGLHQVVTLATTEYRLAVRSRWALALTGLFAVFGLGLATFSGSAVGPSGTERVVASLTSLAVYVVPLAALALGYDAIVGRDEQGWLAVVASLPVTRARIVLGTFLGRATVLTGATVVGFGSVGLLLLRENGTTGWDAFLLFLGGAVGVGAVFLALSVAISAVAGEKTHALGLALVCWVWFVLVHDLLALGVVAAFSLPDAGLSGLVLANPASAFRVFVLGTIGTTTGGGFTAALAETGLSTPLLAGALVGWGLLGLGGAAAFVRRRRL